MKSLDQQLRNHIAGDHTRGCEGRNYACNCGYDFKTEHLLKQAADYIEAAERGYRERATLKREDEQNG